MRDTSIASLQRCALTPWRRVISSNYPLVDYYLRLVSPMAHIIG